MSGVETVILALEEKIRHSENGQLSLATIADAADWIRLLSAVRPRNDEWYRNWVTER